MNERIKQLAEQAGIYKLNLSDETEYWIMEKFAELIVNECMNQVREQYLPVLEDELMMKDTHWDGYVQCGVDSYVAIKEHFFGVEQHTLLTGAEQMSDKGYELSSHEKQAEFTKKRNYTYSDIVSDGGMDSRDKNSA